MSDSIVVRGARVHNLKNISLQLVHDSLIVFTGVSGSGKSSLAFDTVFAEGQRRYLESLSSYQRQFHSQLERPDVDDVEGLPATISLAQHTTLIPQRSTLGTTTEVYDFLRILFARIGQAHCTQCGQPVQHQTAEQILQQVLGLPARSRMMLLAPLVRGRKGYHIETFRNARRAGFVRARVDGEIVDVEPPPTLDRYQTHTIEAIVDRLVIKDGIDRRLKESINLALKHGAGTCVVTWQDKAGQWHDSLSSTEFACAACGLSFFPLEPRSFSFNSPYGACEVCSGIGWVGEDEEHQTCGECGGARLGAMGRAVTIGGQSIVEYCRLDCRTARDRLAELQTDLERSIPAPRLDEARVVMNQLLPEITRRLDFLCEVGLEYLQLDRATSTLSGGELQRARLAGCLGSGLLGACYVLDEPTSGLHPRDTDRLVQTLRQLRDQGNTVLVVEHDEQLMRAADSIVDLGPAAGDDGGFLVGQGSADALESLGESLTGRYLKQHRRECLQRSSQPEATENALDSTDQRWLTAVGLTVHNLQDIVLRIPHQRLTCVTGVSGSGKSSAVMHSLVPALRNWLQQGSVGDVPLRELQMIEPIERLIEVDQRPIGRSARSNPATYAKTWDEIRRVFAATREARLRGFTARRFSFNTGDGRCHECEGQGSLRVEMKFMPDVHVTCSVCRGDRFNPPTLAVRFREHSVADVLRMSFSEAAEFFDAHPKLQRMLRTFVDVGLGYLRIGQSSTTLSGGEAQRVKLASELGRSSHTPTLYVLDEPTSGLHAADIDRLSQVLRRLVEQGHTVVVIEHNMQLIRSADWIIDLGPEAGAAGGAVVAAGSPAQIAQSADGHTAQALRDEFSA